jgi:hypothetical protein
MTRRERLERKLEKRQEWAEARKARAAARFQAAHNATAGIPMGQPILIGHHSESRHRAALARSDANMRAGCESSDMAKHHESKAAGLEAQLEGSIFSDDEDAIEQLEAKIAVLELERDRIKAYNASCRKGTPDESLLDDAQRADLHVVRRVCPYQLGKNGSFPGYKLQYVGAGIKRAKERIEQIKARNERTAKAEASAGGVVIEGAEWVRVTFAEKPDRSVLNALKEAGFRWGGGYWSGKRESLPQSVLEMVA